MKVSELMAGVTPSEEYAGIATNSDFVLAIQTNADQLTEKDYTVVQGGVISHEASLNAETSENQYIRTGKMTTKTGAQRLFTVTGNRMEGDPFQQFVMANKIKFGYGQAVVVPYVYFSMLTGVGEKGKVSIVVTSDQTGEAGENASFEIEMTSTEIPQDYTYISE